MSRGKFLSLDEARLSGGSLGNAGATLVETPGAGQIAGPPTSTLQHFFNVAANSRNISDFVGITLTD